MLLAKELQSTVFITENGRRIKITKIGLLIKQTFNQAIGGNPRLLRSIMQILSPLERLYQTPTNSRHGSNPLEGVNLQGLSMEELVALYRTTVAQSHGDGSS
jgi:hypothetical protein